MSAFRQNPTIQRVLAAIVILVCALGAPRRAAGPGPDLRALCARPTPAAPAALHRGLDRVYRLAMLGPGVLDVTRHYVRDLQAVLFPGDHPPGLAARGASPPVRTAAGRRDPPDASASG